MLTSILALSAAFAAPSVEPEPQYLKAAFAAPAKVAAGSKSSARLKLVIQTGFHIQAHRPLEDYLVPTELSFEPANGLVVGEPAWPKGERYTLKGADAALLAYSGTLSLTLPVSCAAGARPGTFLVKGELTYQACDDKVCFAPTTLPLTLKIHVAPKARKAP